MAGAKTPAMAAPPTDKVGRRFYDQLVADFLKRSGGCLQNASVQEELAYDVAARTSLPTGRLKGMAYATAWPSQGQLIAEYVHEKGKTRLESVRWSWDPVPKKLHPVARQLIEETLTLGGSTNHTDDDPGFKHVFNVRSGGTAHGSAGADPELYFDVVLRPMIAELGPGTAFRVSRKGNPFVAEAGRQKKRSDGFREAEGWARQRAAEGEVARVYAEGPRGKVLVSEIPARSRGRVENPIPKMGDWRSVERYLLSHGWTIQKKGANHRVLISPNAVCSITTSSNFEDDRVIKNIIADIRRCERLEEEVARRKSNPAGSDWRRLERELRADGWRIEITKKNHIKLYSPGGNCIVLASSTPSDSRDLENLKAEIRRCARKETPARHANPTGPTFTKRFESGPSGCGIVIERPNDDVDVWRATASFVPSLCAYAKKRFAEVKSATDVTDLLREFGSESDYEHWSVFMSEQRAL